VAVKKIFTYNKLKFHKPCKRADELNHHPLTQVIKNSTDHEVCAVLLIVLIELLIDQDLINVKRSAHIVAASVAGIP